MFVVNFIISFCDFVATTVKLTSATVLCWLSSCSSLNDAELSSSEPAVYRSLNIQKPMGTLNC